MAYADVVIRIFGRVLTKEDGKDVARYPVELTVNSGQEFPRGYLDPGVQPATPTKAGYADEQYGEALFRWLFSDKTLSNAWAEIRGAHPRRRVRLRIDAEEPELHRAIWEALRDPGDGGLSLALGTTDVTPFSRYLALPSLPGKPTFSRPIRILLVAPAQEDFRKEYPANQYPDLAEIDPAAELQSLTAALQELIDRGAVAPPTLLDQPCSLARIMDELRNGNGGTGYHVLHLVCHGSFNPDQQRARLWLATDDNLVSFSTDEEFATGLYGLLGDGSVQDDDRLRLVFLASCESATRSSADAFRGVAPQLVKAGVPAVVAMQDQVGDQTAREFAAAFYKQLLMDGQVDLAANVARAQITAKHLAGPVIPVLFLRLAGGRLFAYREMTFALRSIFDGLIEDYRALFAGRSAQLRELEAFMRSPASGYLLVTAGAGLGKTALVANLVDRNRQSVAYHFFSPRESESLREEVFLRNLLEQMGPWYGVSDSPAGALVDLRARYDRFLGGPPDGTHTVILDGLDEVEWELSRYLHRPLPAGLKFVLTVRDTGQDPAAHYGLPASQVRPMPLVGLTGEGVQAVLRVAGGGALQFAEDDALLDQVVRVTVYDEARPELGADTLFVRFLAEEAAAGRLESAELATMPPQWKAYLDRWWETIRAEMGAKGRRAERDQGIVDLFGTLAATLGPIGRTELEAINASLVDPLLKNFLDEVIERVRSVVVRNRDGNYVLVHPRLRDNLRAMLETGPYVDKLTSYCAQWPQHKSRYALTYYATHLAEIAAKATGPERHATIGRLVDLVADDDFQGAHLDKIRDLGALQGDLERALRSAATDDDPQALATLVKSSLALVRFRHDKLRPEPIFELARQGDVATARRGLELFELDADWRRATLLEIAWLAARSGAAGAAEAARALRHEIAAELNNLPAGHLPEDNPVLLLQQRINADLDGAGLPPLHLPATPEEWVVQALMNKASGSDADPSLRVDLEFLSNELKVQIDRAELEKGRIFFSQYYGPPLVAYTVDHADSGDRYLEQALSMHSTYSYPNYRYGSLWALLRSVLQHPDPAWVREKVQKLATAALGGSSVEFDEGLPLTVLAVRASADDAVASETLKKRAQQIWDETPDGVSDHDTWSRHKRLLLSLAQVGTRVGDVGHTPDELLQRTHELAHSGLVGFQAPACLTLAEAVRLCQPANLDGIDRALESAQSAAHKIQEGTFCARITARVNAMRASWWPETGLDVVEKSKSLRANPHAVEFASLHYVGHRYGGRTDPPEGFPLPDWVLNANTLRELAKAYHHDLGEFLRLNRGWEPDQAIPEGTSVHVPDPGMAPLLAARLAAETLVAPDLSDAERVALIRSLVPVAAANPTALDTVLARLLLAERPADPVILDKLAALAPMPNDAQADDLQGKLTVVQP